MLTAAAHQIGLSRARLHLSLYPHSICVASTILYTRCATDTGPKTVFFWAPVMKWCLVAAGLKDLSRPADKLSMSQNVGA